MSPDEIKTIFHAQTDNVRELENAWKHINRTINEALRSDNPTLVKFQTRMLGLIFCAYAEAKFSKLLHTPHGFTGDEISIIKKISKNNIFNGWVKCLEIATLHIKSSASNHVPNIKKKIKSLIITYIQEPSLLRNKIAHGQWKTCLNTENTAINSGLTIKLEQLTVIDLYRFKHALDKISEIIEDIVKSPHKAHWKFYWEHITNLEEKQHEISSWTMERKINQLKNKSKHHLNF